MRNEHPSESSCSFDAKRSVRRHHRDRMVCRARKVSRLLGQTGEVSDWWTLRTYQHLARCSCPMCGNPRRWFGEPTVQERRRSEWREEMD